MELRQESVTAGDLDVAYLTCGDGPLAVCLHGFPDSAWTWRHLLPALADAGYRAVAPWLRGYAPTAVGPEERHHPVSLARDAVALHEALGGDGDAVVIGHDWGAMAATGAATIAADRWRRVVTLAVPPAGAVGEAFLSYRQLKRSWYIFMFQSPLAEMAVEMDDFAFIEGLWRDWSPGYTEAADDVARAKDALRGPGHLSAALGYYRSMLQPERGAPGVAPQEGAITSGPRQPQLYLHGVDDGCMGVEVAERAAQYLPVQGSRVELVEGAGHFLHLEQPEQVNRLVVDFCSKWV